MTSWKPKSLFKNQQSPFAQIPMCQTPYFNEKVKGADGNCSQFTSGHHQEGFHSVRESKMCQSTKWEFTTIWVTKTESHQMMTDNSSKSEVIKRRNTMVIKVNAAVQSTRTLDPVIIEDSIAKYKALQNNPEDCLCSLLSFFFFFLWMYCMKMCNYM